MESGATSGKTKPRKTGVMTATQIDGGTRKAKAEGRDIWLSDPAPRREGRLAVRCRPSGVRLLLYRYTSGNGERDALPLGPYDPAGVKGLDLTAARARVGEWARLQRSGIPDLRAHLDAEQRAQEAQDAAERTAAAEAQARATRGSLQALMDAYVAALTGRESQADARGLFRLHVTSPFPDVARTHAADIPATTLRDVLARLVDAEKGRTAAKLRAYLRAAYSTAMRADLDPTVPAAFGRFGITANPLDRLPSLAQFSRALDRALTLPELLAFWRRVVALQESAPRDALVAALLLGGQRPAQLLRVTAADVDVTAGTIALRDIKGRKRALNPRVHVLPIVDELVPVIRRRRSLCDTADAPLFSTSGKVPLRLETVAALVADIVIVMEQHGELERGRFTLRDLRRTAETHMAALGITSDIRAQIQSHGLGGIQQRHYDRHDYMPEKRAALDSWARRLSGTAAKVTPIKARRRAS